MGSGFVYLLIDSPFDSLRFGAGSERNPSFVLTELTTRSLTFVRDDILYRFEMAGKGLSFRVLRLSSGQDGLIYIKLRGLINSVMLLSTLLY
jgi:hypothetical protein